MNTPATAAIARPIPFSQESPAPALPAAAPLPGSRADRDQGRRELYFREALRSLPRLVTLLDTNPFRPTYGSFDREHWHYRTADFPCAMHTACVLPLALFYLTPHDDNPLHGVPRVREWIHAALEFARHTSNRDGSGDDYYPGERALGATAFALFAASEAYIRLGLNDARLVEFFRKRARWIAEHREPGAIANHQALAALSLFNVHRLTGDTTLRRCANARILSTLALQTAEGWFMEYDGCDPGYNTWTIDFLAKYHAHTQDERVFAALERAVDFAKYFLHSDGSYGGVYGSRESWNFHPHGFELLAPRLGAAARLAEGFLDALAGGAQAQFDDHRIFHHHLENYLLAYEDFAPAIAPPMAEPAEMSRYFPEAGLLVRRWGDYSAVVSLKKGGAFRLFRGSSPLRTESGYAARLDDGGVAVSNVLDETRAIEVTEHCAAVHGVFHRQSFTYATPLAMVAFRVLLLVARRIPGASRMVKALLQRLLILKKHPAPVRFSRTFTWRAEGLSLDDRIQTQGSARLAALAAGSDGTTRYTAIGAVYHPSRLDPWISFDAAVATGNGDAVQMERLYS